MNTQSLQHMWQRVILQALRDAVANPPKMDSAQKVNRREARAWLEGRSGDFDCVCTLAGFNPDVVRNWWKGIKDDKERLDAAASRFREAATNHGYGGPRRPDPI